MIVRREVFESIGLLDEGYFLYFEETDFCLRARVAGYRNVWTPFAEMYHHESASRGEDDTRDKTVRFEYEYSYMRAKWGPFLDDDPAYNPNLTLVHEDFRLAWPPRPIERARGERLQKPV